MHDQATVADIDRWIASVSKANLQGLVSNMSNMSPRRSTKDTELENDFKWVPGWIEGKPTQVADLHVSKQCDPPRALLGLVRRRKHHAYHIYNHAKNETTA